MKKSILVFLFALLGILSAHAYDFEVDGIYYNLISGTDQVAVTYVSNSYTVRNDYTGSVVIPSTVTYNFNGKTYAVTSIENRAFYYCEKLTSVTIPESVTVIGSYAFEDCTSISSPLYNSKVFAYMPKTYNGGYTIPSGIQTIAGGAFSGCSGLTSVTIPDGVTAIGEYAFYGCSGLTSVTIPESVTSIGYKAFAYCRGLTSVTIPEGVDTIGSSAFAYCTGLTSVTIGESVTFIGDMAFGGCSALKAVEWNARHCKSFESSPFGSVSFIIFGKEVEYIPGNLCSGCSGLKSVTIPESVPSIGSSAFRGCFGLTSLKIPEGVSSIG
ncbi:MAG: leucine-rich repeat domain-containing protein, partial [Bacteroidales bacterium]|nr:leucine-rich repeat domain-containing protein [Bacteroidales bacterium]